LLLPQIRPVFSVVAPCDPGAAPGTLATNFGLWTLGCKASNHTRQAQRHRRLRTPTVCLRRSPRARIMSPAAAEIGRLVRHEEELAANRPCDFVGLAPHAGARGLAEHGHGGRLVRRARPVGDGAGAEGIAPPDETRLAMEDTGRCRSRGSSLRPLCGS
jgi:hypothetical protein